MARIFGRNRHEKHLSDSAMTPDGIHRHHPMYAYAVEEIRRNMLAPGTSNDDGSSIGQPVSAPSSFANHARGGDYYYQQHDPEQEEQRATAAIQQQQQSPSNISSNNTVPDRIHTSTNPFLNSIADANYEEFYGDAYTGGPIKYVYPSGYQSMRPRSCPWRLSIAVCVIFTWLSIFIVGHCSDRVEQDYVDDVDDDTLVIDIRWCGSRILYLMWACSMLITGLSAAYCGVIGYIKVRDFAVANSRSQPVVVDGKSDYYVQINNNNNGRDSDAGSTSSLGYRSTIYQADGTPQFWGGHIYRPTQAAVAVTSR